MRNQSPETLGCNCAACPFKANKNKPVWGEIPFSHQAVLVGEYPTSDDVEFSRPLMGNTGRELDVSLANAKLARKNLAIINAALCKPPANADDNDIKAAVKCCKPALTYQITENKLNQLPRLLMGKAAYYAFYSKVNVDTARGFIRDENTIVTYNPTYAYYQNPYAHAAFDIDVARFGRVITGSCESGPSKIITNPSVEDFRGLARDAKGILACDIETTSATPERHYEGKDPTRAVLKTVGFGCETWGLSIWWESVTKELEEEVRKILHDDTVTKVFHNGYWFDIPVLRRYGFSIRNVEDTRDMRRALSATSILSLRYLASLHTDYFPWKETEAGADEGDTK